MKQKHYDVESSAKIQNLRDIRAGIMDFIALAQAVLTFAGLFLRDFFLSAFFSAAVGASASMTRDYEVVELLLVTVQVGGMYSGGDYAVAVVEILAHAEVVTAGGSAFADGLSPFAVIAQYLLVPAHEPPHSGGNGVLKHHRVGYELLA